LICIASAACYASLSILGKLGFAAGMTLTGLLSLRFTGAALLLAGVLLALRRPLFPGRTAAGRLFLLGAIMYAGQAALFFGGLQRLPAGIAALLLYVYPVIVAGLDWAVNRRRPAGRVLVAMVLALAGVVLTLSPRAEGSIDLLGAALVLTSATGLSVYIILSEGLTRNVGSRVGAMWITAGAGLTFTLVGAGTGTLHWEAARAAAWIMSAIVVFGTVLPVTLFLAGMARVGPTAASLLSTLEPVFTVAMGALWLSETLTWTQILGGGLVLIAAILVTTRPARPIEALPGM
jgi:drug/metabolite transporter (DMT)-like permease